MYNFWFEINRPPVAGTVELGLFKPHMPQSVTFPAPVPLKCSFAMGDVNTNAAIDGDDVSHFVNCLISGVSTGGDCNCADMNFTNCADTGDIVLFTDQLMTP